MLSTDTLVALFPSHDTLYYSLPVASHRTTTKHPSDSIVRPIRLNLMQLHKVRVILLHGERSVADLLDPRIVPQRTQGPIQDAGL